MPIGIYAQVAGGTSEKSKKQNGSTEIQLIDSLLSQKVSKIIGYIEPQRFKMYQTENIYNLLKLDTWTGRVWQVQWGNHGERMEVGINRIDLRELPVEGESAYEAAASNRYGRFELCPTKNIYTFILLDTYTGKTYQVQWSTSPYERFCVPILD